MSLEAKARAFAKRYPTPASHPNGGDNNWDQDCGSLIWRFCDYLGWVTHPSGDISSAYRAALRSGPLNGDSAAAPVGAFHFYDVAGPANGHVQIQVDSNTLVFQGSAKVWEDVGRGVGFGSVADYLAKTPGARYLGWATNYAGGTINAAAYGAAPAGTGTTPVTNSEEHDMSISFVPDANSATIFVCSVDNGRRVPIGSPYHMTLLQRFQRNGGSDRMLIGELDIVRGYLSQLETPDASGAVLAAVKNISINPADVQKAVKAAIAEGIELTAKVKPEELDAAAERFAKLLGVRIAGGDLA